MRFISRLGVSTALMTLLTTQTAKASCGLEHCPITRDPATGLPFTSPYQLQARAQSTSFDIDQTKGHYHQIFVSGEYRGLKSIAIGFNVPLTRLTTPEESLSGLGNSVLYGEWRHVFSDKIAASFGTQIELPLGTDPLLADGHAVVMPYGTIHLTLGSFYWMGNLGFAKTIDSHDHDHSNDKTPVYVNPHDNEEMVYRLGIGAPFSSKRVQPLILIEGQQVLGHGHDRTLVQGGGRIQAHLNGSLSVHASFLVPVTTARRWENRFQVGLIGRL